MAAFPPTIEIDQDTVVAIGKRCVSVDLGGDAEDGDEGSVEQRELERARCLVGWRRPGKGPDAPFVWRVATLREAAEDAASGGGQPLSTTETIAVLRSEAELPIWVRKGTTFRMYRLEGASAAPLAATAVTPALPPSEAASSKESSERRGAGKGRERAAAEDPAPETTKSVVVESETAPPTPDSAAAFAQRLLRERFVVVATLEIEAWTSAEPLSFAHRLSGKHLASLHVGDSWGPLFGCAWFRFFAVVRQKSLPSASSIQQAVALLDVNGELLVVSATGAPVRGLTNQTSCFDRALGLPGKTVLPLLEVCAFSSEATDGTQIEFWADGGANDLFGYLQGEGRIAEATIALPRPGVSDLAYDVEFLADLAGSTAVVSQRVSALRALGQCEQRYVGAGGASADDTAVAACREIVDTCRKELVAAANAEAATKAATQKSDASNGTATPNTSLAFSAVGHAHLDLAWLWPVRESRRKSARTLATALRNIDAFPGYVFGVSQPQQLAWIREDHPALFQRVQAAVAAGRIECQGGMWVECDTNLVSAESLARQLLYGQRAWKEWFGVRPRTCWLPDVFGYSAALPQILRQAGLDWFMTIKLSWSTTNKFPHHTFRWKSPDGSEVLAHMPPEGTYNSPALPRSLLTASAGFLDHARSDKALIVFGIGDGGGGPGEEHLERIKRVGGYAPAVLPSVQLDTAEHFFANIESQRAQQAAWVGELYLEKHQGTLTSQGRTKFFNRRLEWGLRQAELAACRAWLVGGRDGSSWPQERLAALWRDTLLFQFHDVLPGSSIGRVYSESEKRSAEMLDEIAAITAGADAESLTGIGLWIVNDSSWSRKEWVRVPASLLGTETAPWVLADVPGLAAAKLGAAGEANIATTAAATTLEATPRLLNNGLIRVVFDANGAMTSIVDVDAGRGEVLAGRGNQLICFEDTGCAWDFTTDYHINGRAWEPTLHGVAAGVDGPEAWVEQSWVLNTCGDADAKAPSQPSTLVQRIVLTAGSRRLEFRTTVDWQERARMLRVRFPVAVHAEHARCEIAVGSIARPTHRNTSWDVARTEVSAHSWADLSERSYGVALLNNGKYGHRLDGNVFDMALLRSPSYPDPDADRGAHTFTYALLPHRGDHVEGRVTEEAHALNCPLRVARGGNAKENVPAVLASLVRLENAPGVIVTAMKRAEDAADVLVVRLMEIHGVSASNVQLFCPVVAQRGIASAHEGNLLEETGSELVVKNGGDASKAFVCFDMKPWTLRTVLLRMK